MKELTAKQELFLEYLFNDPECGSSTHLAAQKAGYDTKDHWKIIQALSEEIVKRAQSKLAISAPKAVTRLVDMMDEDKSTPGAEIRIKAVEGVLDRLGIAKKQQVEISSDAEKSPIFFIPAKAATPVEVTKEEDNGSTTPF